MHIAIPWRDMTEVQRIEYALHARSLNRSNPRRYQIASLAAAVGATYRALRDRYDADKAKEQKRASANRKRERRENANAAGVSFSAIEPATPSDVAARLAEIPPDTRSLTASIMGDPIPGDQRRQRWAEANPDRRPITLPKGLENGL